MSSDFDALLDQMVPGTGRGAIDDDDPIFPQQLDLEPLGVLGRGGAGVVYRARDPILGREVAVKISRTEGGAALREALLREAQLTSRLQHPAILPVHRVTAAAGVLCVIYQLAPERTLAAKLAEERRDRGVAWPLQARMATLLDVVGALAHAHQLDIVHGDLHPGNVVIDDEGSPFVLDWSGSVSRAGELSGRPAYAAPEQLLGEPVTARCDVFALGALAWELATLRPLREPIRGEGVGSFVRRWRDAPEPAVPADMDADLGQLCLSALSNDPARRPSAQGMKERLAEILSGQVIRARRAHDAEALAVLAQEALTRFEERTKRIAEERTVVTVQRAKIPGHAPVVQKRSLWAAEDRVRELDEARTNAWLEAVEAATRVTTLAPATATESVEEARRILAKLWWERMRNTEDAHMMGDAKQAEQWVRVHDDGRFTHILEADAHVSLTASVPGATARICRMEERGRVLVPVEVSSNMLPLERHPLKPGSWLVIVEAEGHSAVRYPILLDRLEHHVGAVQMHTAQQVGEGWVQIPAGRYRLGGDPNARQPLDPCAPFLGDLFIQRTCVTARDWVAFLNDLPLDRARDHVPGEAGLFGAGLRAYWEHDGNQWVLPELWHPDWPAFSVNMADIEAYAAWLSSREGRTVRLPTEEEWEKAARGVDGRSYPWGEHFDPTFAHMRQSRPGPPSPHPVGDYPVDTSVFGCQDMAGGMRELTASVFDVGQNVIRGGTWGDDADDLRCANRAGLRPEFRYAFISFRLISESPRP